jgi:hypothetical protein
MRLVRLYHLCPLVIDDHLPGAHTADGDRGGAPRFPAHRHVGIGDVIAAVRAGMHDERHGIEHEIGRREDIHTVIEAGNADILGPGADAQPFQHDIRMRARRTKPERRKEGRPENHPDPPRVFGIGPLERPLRPHRPAIGQNAIPRAAMALDVQCHAIEAGQDILLLFFGEVFLPFEMLIGFGRQVGLHGDSQAKRAKVGDALRIPAHPPTHSDNMRHLFRGIRPPVTRLQIGGARQRPAP